MKKAISPLIAWILLIGFTVTMAAFISNWVIQQTKETFQPEKLLESMSCEGVSFSITTICIDNVVIGDCPEGNKYYFDQIKVKNKGAYTIRNITILSLYEHLPQNKLPRVFNAFIEYYLKPGDEKEMNFKGEICIKPDKKNEIKLIPAIEKDNKVSYCTDNAVILNNEAIGKIEQCTIPV